MSPEQVPTEWVELAERTLAFGICADNRPDGKCDCPTDEQIRVVLAAALPLAQAAALEEASVEVLSLGVVSGSGVHVGRRAASWLGRRAARLREGSKP